ncbi:hypothetical protein HOL63_03085 [Candidatus Peregrinibacteria bacterium]|jgi:hypothetical protein|nr:hypothetical protein [Candidatus Peregrinibacteria bacterium]MBT5468359.1 hypothetical protein [Candidatus Peregrinibacteria bacterium]MBT7338039.1 hypothetical protein [Candidatus Peregrinibacteria bacterium]
MDIKRLSRRRFLHTVTWGVMASLIVVGGAAGIGRATKNLTGALTDKPDIAIYLLLPDEKIGKTTILRELEEERHYLAETKDGPKLVILKMGEEEWFVSSVESLRP